MAYLEFNKKELVNLEYSLKREYLATNHSGGYLNTTISGCNTRKYHGLLVLPIENFGGEKHVLLSSLDETLIQHGKEFNLGIHCYGEIYEPRGHKYIENFETDKIIAITYSVGGMKVRKVMMMSNREERMFVSYTLLEAHSPVIMRLKPFLAFRHIHTLSSANTDVNTKSEPVKNGRSFCLYDGFPSLNLQLNVKSEFISNPDWYYNIEYKEESRRVYESTEDLFVPGFFELALKKNRTVIFSASLKEENPAKFSERFRNVLEKKRHRDSYVSCLKISADQFVVRTSKDVKVQSGYPWLDENPRDTLMFLPGLTLCANHDIKVFRAILDSLIKRYEWQLLVSSEKADLPLWLFWTLQQYSRYSKEPPGIWKKYGKLMEQILESYASGARNNVMMHENGLLWAEQRYTPLTWMDAYVDGIPVTERAGYQIEVNALWYNALCYAVELAGNAGERDFVQKWTVVTEKIRQNFTKAFKIEGADYLADHVAPGGQNRDVRPNQMFACAFDYSPLNEEMRAMVMESVTKELLTSRGIRTLSPKNQKYRGEYDGDQISRDLSYHQGTARVWLLSFYAEAMFRLYGKSFIRKAEEITSRFEEDITTHCIGSVSEVYDGDPPHQPHGATSYSGSVAALLHLISLTEQYK